MRFAWILQEKQANDSELVTAFKLYVNFNSKRWGGKKDSIQTWQKGSLIGRGAFGKVYQCLNFLNGEIFCSKQIRISGKKAAKSLQNELDVLKSCEHRNIIDYIGHERVNNNLFIFTEYASGGSIASLLNKYI